MEWRADPCSAVFAALGLSDEEQSALWQRIRAIGPPTLAGLKEHEARRMRAADEPRRAQTDFLGLDVMVEMRGGVLTPVVIEVNDHETGGLPEHNEFAAPEEKGSAVRLWALTMWRRALVRSTSSMPLWQLISVADGDRITTTSTAARSFQDPHPPPSAAALALPRTTPRRCCTPTRTRRGTRLHASRA